jgi:hypothetical protein
VPGQTGNAGLAAIVTDAATIGLTVITIVLDVAVGDVAQTELDVIITFTTSPFWREEEL